MNVLQYKPEGTTSNKKWITTISIAVGSTLILGGVLGYFMRDVGIFGASVILALVVLAKLVSIKNVREIQISNANLTIRVIWTTLRGKEKFQDFDINDTLQLKVGPYQPPKFGYRSSASTAHWGIHISQKGRGAYASGYGLFSQYRLEDLEGEAKAILEKIKKEPSHQN